MHGVLVVDKPAGASSAATVEQVKRVLGVPRAGHGGTLDPIATGVLPVCLNAGTKLASYLLADDKAYEAVGVFGIETDTLDRTGRVTAEHAVTVDEAALRAVLAAHTGERDQVPPMYSAIKQGGVRLYERARAGEEVERAPRRVRIDRLELLDVALPRFRVAIACSKGTYVRSIVADVGRALGCGAHLAELRRTRSGRFAIDQAVTLDALATMDPAAIAAAVIPLGQATGLPSIVVPEALLARVRAGGQLALERLGAPPDHEQFQLVDPEGRLVAIVHPEAGHVVYDRVFPEHATS